VTSRRPYPPGAVRAVALVLVACWSLAGCQTTAPEPEPAAGSVAGPAATSQDGLHVRWLPSPGSGRPRAVWVYRPPGVPDSASLPVLYLLHGYPGDPAAFAGSLALDAMMSAFTRSGGPPFVIVLPEGDGDSHPDSEWADAVDGTDLIETFVTSVVIPAVEGGNRRTAADRAVAGFSMGGYGAMNLALRHRDLFGQVASLAGYFSVDDPDGVFGGRPAAIAANSPDRNLRAAAGLRILLSDGTGDGEAVTQGQTQRFASLLAGAGIAATTQLVPGGQHNTAYVRAELPAVAAFLAAGWLPAH
jgi:S-formylglutathione hydrolase FrmB